MTQYPILFIEANRLTFALCFFTRGRTLRGEIPTEQSNTQLYETGPFHLLFFGGVDFE